MAERTQNINSSPSVSTITNNDDIFVSQNGATLAKIDYNLLAKAIIEQYTGSTLAGSAQAVKTALDGLNSYLTDLRGVSVNTGVPDILAWALTIDGFGTCRTSPGTTNLPSAAGNSYGIAICEAWNRTTDNKWDRLFWFPTNVRDIWVNSKTNTADWLGWQKLPTRDEVDTLNSKSATYNLTSSENLLTVALDDTKVPLNQIKVLNLRNANTSDLPSSSSVYALAVARKRNAGNCTVTIYTEGGNEWTNNSSNGTWRGWKQRPTRDEINSTYYLGQLAQTTVANLNTFTTPGTYYFNTTDGTTALNFPIADSGKLIVEMRISSTNYLKQTYYSANNDTYTRNYNSGTWTAWQKMPTTTDLNNRFGGASMSLFNLSETSGSSNNAIRFTGTSASDATEHEYFVVGISNGNKMFGFYAYIRFSTQTLTVYSFGDVNCTGTISGNTATIKVATWMKGFGIVRNKIDNVSYVSV